MNVSAMTRFDELRKRSSARACETINLSSHGELDEKNSHSVNERCESDPRAERDAADDADGARAHRR